MEHESDNSLHMRPLTPSSLTEAQTRTSLNSNKTSGLLLVAQNLIFLDNELYIIYNTSIMYL